METSLSSTSRAGKVSGVCKEKFTDFRRKCEKFCNVPNGNPSKAMFVVRYIYFWMSHDNPDLIMNSTLVVAFHLKMSISEAICSTNSAFLHGIQRNYVIRNDLWLKLVSLHLLFSLHKALDTLSQLIYSCTIQSCNTNTTQLLKVETKEVGTCLHSSDAGRRYADGIPGICSQKETA